MLKQNVLHLNQISYSCKQSQEIRMKNSTEISNSNPANSSFRSTFYEFLQ